MISFEVSGQNEVAATLSKLGDQLDPEGILDEAVAILLNRIRQRFLAEVDPDGRPWIPSLASRIRKATGRGGGTLFDTGRLFHSIQEYKDSPETRYIGTNVPYAEKHQLGLNGMVRRQFIGASVEDEDLMVRLVEERVRRALS